MPTEHSPCQLRLAVPWDRQKVMDKHDFHPPPVVTLDSSGNKSHGDTQPLSVSSAFCPHARSHALRVHLGAVSSKKFHMKSPVRRALGLPLLPAVPIALFLGHLLVHLGQDHGWWRGPSPLPSFR